LWNAFSSLSSLLLTLPCVTHIADAGLKNENENMTKRKRNLQISFF
ncbi:MAG: hypothetical protein ACI8RD_009033, partial [Bacillariaceae sp.]